MADLLIRIAIALEDHQRPSHIRPHGPLFHRWLPDGESDGIRLPIDDSSMELTVWFERHGYVADNGFIEFTYDQRAVDPAVMILQAKLDAGPLFGHLTVTNLSSGDIDVLENHQIGHDRYVQLAKRIVKAIHPPIFRLLRLISVTYGQYWIRDFDAWDSRRESLGAYCSSQLQLDWSTNQGQSWSNFQPTEKSLHHSVAMSADHEYEKYLLKEDYQEFERQLEQAPQHSLAATAVSLAHSILDQDNLEHGFVQGVTALELAIHDYLMSTATASETLRKSLQPFHKLPLGARLASMAAGRTDLKPDMVEEALEAIKIRNKIVHEGWRPSPNATNRKAAESLLIVASSFLSGTSLKFPSLNSGNQVCAPPGTKIDSKEEGD